MLYRFLRPTIFTLALAVSLATAQQPAPSEERLRAHVTRLSSTEFDGRRTGTAGADTAAEYIASEFRRYGLRAPADAKNYRQQFPFIADVQLGRNNSMLFKTRADKAAALDLRLGEDWSPLGFSASARVAELPLVFVGFGITASALNYDDYAGVETGNRIALAFAGAPDGESPHGTFARYAELRWKAAAARDRGARALVVIAREANFKEDRLAQLRNDYTAGDAGLPVVVISRAAARRILEAGGVTGPLDEIEQTLARNAQASASSSPAATPKNFSALLNNAVMLTIQTEIVRESRAAANVVGILPGADEKLKSETIVIGAHYDHLGRGGSGSLAARAGAVHHGADDNASGTAALLELARMFSDAPARRTIVFAAFSGEEEGLLGSNYYVNHPPLPLAQTVAMLNLDMVGRLKGNQLSIGGVGTAAEWREWINSANTAARFSLSLGEDGFGPSDHSSFYAKQIPVLFFWTGTHEDYHKPSDTAEKINYEGQRRITALIRDLVGSIDRGAQKPTYTTARSTGQNRSTGFRVYLGTVPSYADSGDGVKIDGVRDDSPAARAGLRPGDRIVKLAGREVRNVYDYTYALAEMRADQTYQVEIVRANEGKLTLSITPAVRK